MKHLKNFEEHILPENHYNYNYNEPHGSFVNFFGIFKKEKKSNIEYNRVYSELDPYGEENWEE